jgi:hypothetical protein
MEENTLTPEIAMVAGGVVLLIGGILLAWGLRMARRQRRAAKTHARTTGTVLENKMTEGMENSTFYCPIVEFTSASGQKVRVQCLGNTQIVYPVGTSVPILYDPERPEQAGIVGEGSLGIVLVNAFAVGVTLLGLLIFAFGLIGLVAGGFPSSR